MKLLYMLLMIPLLIALIGCSEVTYEQHIERITQRVNERFFASDSNQYGFDGTFSVSLLQDIDGNTIFFMVEFNPDGFLYGWIYRNDYWFNTFNFWTGSAGIWHGPGNNRGWSFEVDDPTFLPTIYYRSHFEVANVPVAERRMFSMQKGHMRALMYLDGTWVYIVDQKEWLQPSIIPSGFTRSYRGSRL